MSTSKESTPRSIETLIEHFQKSAGNFAAFHKGMSEREKCLFKGWLHKMRATPAVIS